MDKSRQVQDMSPGSPLTTQHLDLSHEWAIVWVRGAPDDYPYLREEVGKADTRTGRVPARGGHPVVAYAALAPDAPNNGHPGVFERRVWRFAAHDPYPCDRDHPN